MQGKKSLRADGVMLLLVLLILFPMLAFAGCPTGTGGANWLGGQDLGSETATPVGFERPNMDMPTAVPKANMDMPAGGSVSSTSNAATSSATTGDNNTTTTTASEEEPEVQLNLTGRWNLELHDNQTANLTRQAALTFYPAGAMVSGIGNLTDIDREIPVVVRGFLEGELVRLDILQTVDGEKYRQDTLYRMRVSLTNQTISGKYDKYGTNGLIGSVVGNGTVTGRRVG